MCFSIPEPSRLQIRPHISTRPWSSFISLPIYQFGFSLEVPKWERETRGRLPVEWCRRGNVQQFGIHWKRTMMVSERAYGIRESGKSFLYVCWPRKASQLQSVAWQPLVSCTLVVNVLLWLVLDIGSWPVSPTRTGNISLSQDATEYRVTSEYISIRWSCTVQGNVNSVLILFLFSDSVKFSAQCSSSVD